MTCKDCIHSGVCYKENDYANFPDRCGEFISDKVLEERPQGDLISRSEVEKLGATCLARRNENGQLEAIISLDNAPTVDVDKEFIDKIRATGNFKNGYQLAKNYYKRPQGHWINSQVGQTCNLCKEIQFGYDSFRHFCPNCGADMRGDKE